MKNFEARIEEAVKTMTALKDTVEELEEALKNAKRKYETFRTDDFPLLLREAGIEALTTASGLRVELVREITCSPNKNDKDQASLMKFLRKHNGAHLIKELLEVVPDEKTIQALEASNIDYNIKESVNTISLKAFLKAKLGWDGVSVATLKEEQIPECLHFYAPVVVKIK